METRPRSSSARHSASRSSSNIKADVASLSKKAGVDESVRAYKLLEALRNGSRPEIDMLIVQESNEINDPDGRASISSTSPIDQLNPLLLAVQCADTPTFKYVLDKGIYDINARDHEGNTVLHYAARLGREDVVTMLLDEDYIQDQALDHNKRTPAQVARTPELAQKIRASRQNKLSGISKRFSTALHSRDYDSLDAIFDDRLSSSAIDLNRIYGESGSTLLHDAVRNRDQHLVKWLLQHDADPFKRDRKGKNSIEITKDDSMKQILRNSQQGALVAGNQSPQEPVTLSGYLKKWTNYKSGYRMRWLVLENGVLSYFKHHEDTQTACRGSISLAYATLHYDASNKSTFEVLGHGSVKYALKASHPVEAQRWVWALTTAIQQGKDKAKAERSQQGASHPKTSTQEFGGTDNGDETLARSNFETASRHSAGTDDEDSVYGDSDEKTAEPHADTLELNANSIKMQVGIAEQLCNALTQQANGPDSTQQETVENLRAAIHSMHLRFPELLRMASEREHFLRKRIDHEMSARKLWEESMQNLAAEQEEMQVAMLKSESERKKTKRALRAANAKLGTNSPVVSSPVRQRSKEDVEQGLANANLPHDQLGSPQPTDAPPSSSSDDDEEDEFYDAVGSGDVKVAQLNTSSTQDLQQSNPGKQKKHQMINPSFKGYEEPIRTRLDVVDDRPKISLWSILKSMIGKDMTKMTLPVTFNEPTSLLQRAAEDMEYADLLDTAATCEDSTERLLYVAAFAASEYSSTSNRIAKPFNPLLGETFEYCRPDKAYRFLIEQVSHHPPIGAAYAESPHWDYYGESSVKSKFYGKSFDINPLGTWFLNLRHKDGEELYTWKKVTSSVVGIITGSPTVDNFGPMQIMNHTTSDRCELDFKQRGWRGANAYEVKGTVFDKNDRAQWSIGGHWNDKIYARKLNQSGGADTAVLLWQSHPRHAAPFNLTEFVISLNALPQSLKLWIPQTDTRLRPDQRAMEEGKYDLAAEEKNRVEEKQRAKRRQREADGKSHQPRWFEKSKHPVTGEVYWKFRDDYWDVREKVGEARLKGQKAEWADVEEIF